MADGSVTINTKMDTSGVEKGADDIVQSLKNILGYMQNISSNVEKLVTNLTSGSNAAGKAVSNLTDNLEATAEAGKRAVKEISKFDPSDISGLVISRPDSPIDDAGEITKEESQAMEERTREYRKAAKERADAYNTEKEKVNELKKAYDDAQKALKSLELQGKYTGDKEWEDAYFNLEKIKKEINDTKKDILSPLKNPFDLVSLSGKIKKTEQDLKDLEKSGHGLGTEDYDRTYSKLVALTAEAKEYKKNIAVSAVLGENNKELEKTSNSVSRLGEKVGKLSQKLMSSGISGLKDKIKSIAKTIDKLVTKLLTLTSGAILGGLQRISSGIFAIHKSANKSTLSLKNLLKYAFGIRSLFALINRIRSAAVEGLQNLAKYDSLGNVNQSISSLISALTRLKNSFATAFAPILTAVAPILVRFINLISEAVTRVGMLIAALTGQKTFTRAIAVQENYAASLDKTADSAKKATKAVKGYLSPLDEMDRYDSGKNDTGIGSSGGYTGPSSGDMFEEVPIANSLKGIADKIKKLIKDEDWEGLGAYMADGINKGLEKVYNVINWDNVGPKITPFIKGFTETFNSLVDHIDWNLMGRTVGAGINTIVKSLNLAITGIDWFNLGKKFAQGVQGIITETNWNELGQLLGNRFMALWRVFGGFVKNLPYRNIGKAVADGLNGVFSTISFSEISDYLTTAINGAFESLDEFTKDFEWDEFAENVKNGITDFINGIEWEKNGKIFGNFLSELCDAINTSITEETFYSLGKGIGDFLGQLPWGKLLWTAGKMIIGGLKWALEGLWKSEGLPGKIAAVIIAAFGLIKLGTLLDPIKILVGWIVGKIADRMIATESTAAISKGVGNMMSTALSGAASGAKDLAGALGPLVGTAGLIIAVGGAATVATSELAGLVETMQGGNGIGTTFGNTMNNFIQALQRRGDIISGSAEEIWQLKESLEQEGMTAEDKAGATQKLIDKLGEMGVTSDQAEQAFSSLYQQGLITDDMFDILSEAIKTLDDNTTNMAGSIDLSKQSIDDLYDNVLPQLQTQLGLSADQVTALDTALIETESSGGTAQDAFNRIMERAEELGINTESVAKIFAEVFPDAVKEMEKSTKNSMDNTQKSVETGMGAASAATGAAMAGIQKSTEESMSAAEKAVSDSTSNISTDSDRNWSTAEGFATGAMENVGQYTYDKMKEVYGVVSRYNSSIQDDFDKKWGSSQNTVSQAIQNMASRVLENCSAMVSGVENAFSNIPGYISNIMNNAVGKVNGAISNINSALGRIERSFTFTYNFTNPITKNKGTYRSWMNLPRVNTVPYLASGAVIPPRSEFLAVLGDQKNGKNLEAPEETIREIINDALAQNQGGGETRIIIQLDRRTIYDSVIKEAKTRRDTTGKNPFDLI